MAEPGRRLLVPTDRQARRGETSVGRAALDAVDADQADVYLHDPNPRMPAAGPAGNGRGRRAATVRRAMGETGRALDPRQLEGPVLPLVVFCLISLFARVEDQALGVLLPEIRSQFGVSVAFLAGLSSVLGLANQALLLPFGYLADRVRRVVMIRLSALGAAGSVLLQGLAPSVPLLVLGRATSGVASSLAPAASFPLLADYYPSRSRARAFGLYYAAAQVGAIAGPPVAGLLSDHFGWRVAIVGVSGMALLAALMAFTLREPVRGRIDRLEAGASEEVADEPQEPVSWAETWRAASTIATLRRLWYATPLIASSGLFTILVLPFYLSEVFQLSGLQRGLVLAAYQVSGLVGVLAAGPIGDRLIARNPALVMTYGALTVVGQVVAIVMLSVAPNLSVAVVALVLMGFVSVVLTPAFFTLISLVVPARVRGLGLQTAAPWQIAGIILAGVMGASAESMGLRHGVLLFVPTLLAGAAIFASGGATVARDIRAATAAGMADEESRQARAAGRTKLLVCRDVDVTYDGVQVLFGVDLDVEQGECVALLGTNGAGKSTLLRAIAGVSEASNGAIFFDGRDITHAPPHAIAAGGVVMMPGGSAVFPGLTVAENLYTAAGADHPSIDEVLDLFPALRNRLDDPAGDLSGGEQQMVGIGQAFLMRPRLLMIDELSLGLAPAVVADLLEVLARVNRQGTTVVLVEQSLNVALTIAERAVFMEKGEVRFDGPTEELLSRPELVRSVFLGRSRSTPGRRSSPARRGERHSAGLGVVGLSVTFGGVSALADVTFAVDPGEVLGIIGPNGAGKTTLFDAISGLVPAQAGQVTVGDVDVSDRTPDQRAVAGIGRSFQSARLFPSLTVRETISTAFERMAVRNPALTALSAPSVRRTERSLRRRVDGLIEMVGLEPYADAFVGELSTGTRRAVDVACVMALDPAVLLLDEPSSGLAQAESEALGPLLTQLSRDTGCAMVVIEHDIPLVTSIATRMLAMELGRVVVTGLPADVCSDPRVVTSYLAASDDVIARSGARGVAIARALGAPLERGR